MAGRLKGAAELERRLLGLKQSLRNRALRPGVTKAARAIAKAVKAALPRGPTGLLRKSIGQKVFTSRSRGVMGLVGARTGFAATVNGVKVDPTKYLHLVERGRKAVAMKGRKLMLRGRGRAGLMFRGKVGPAVGQHILAGVEARMRGSAQAAVWQAVEGWLAKAGK